jgi:hypothetical protein
MTWAERGTTRLGRLLGALASSPWLPLARPPRLVYTSPPWLLAVETSPTIECSTRIFHRHRAFLSSSPVRTQSTDARPSMVTKADHGPRDLPLANATILAARPLRAMAQIVHTLVHLSKPFQYSSALGSGSCLTSRLLCKFPRLAWFDFSAFQASSRVFLCVH